MYRWKEDWSKTITLLTTHTDTAHGGDYHGQPLSLKCYSSAGPQLGFLLNSESCCWHLSITIVIVANNQFSHNLNGSFITSIKIFQFEFWSHIMHSSLSQLPSWLGTTRETWGTMGAVKLLIVFDFISNAISSSTYWLPTTDFKWQDVGLAALGVRGLHYLAVPRSQHSF